MSSKDLNKRKPSSIGASDKGEKDDKKNDAPAESSDHIEDTQAKERRAQQPPPRRHYTSAFCIGFVAPALVIWLSWALFPIMYHKDVLGGVRDFADCTIVTYDAKSEKMLATNETIEIAQVDHEIKLVQAKTYEGSIYGLGFVHAKDRLFQLYMTKMIAQGRVSELIGSEGIKIDKYVRQLGITRAAQSRFESMSAEESAIYVNYAAGINKVVENLKVYPMEFFVLMTSFEPWTVKDSISIEYLFNAMLSTDWFAEMLRLRLLEVYDRELVDQLLPFKDEHLFPFANATTISDDELAEMGKLRRRTEGERDPLFDIDGQEDWLYQPRKTDKVQVDSERKRDGVPHKQASPLLNVQTGSGTNCFAVHGNYTQKGKPFLACDPHLVKAVNSYFYLTRLTWNETKELQAGATLAEDEDAEYKTYLIGASLVGLPVISYGRSPFASWGISALYPDVIDLFVEDVKDDSFYFDAVSGKYEAFTTVSEKIKVRFGEDVTMTHRVTRSGVLMNLDLLDGSAGQAMPWITQEAVKDLGPGK